MGEHLPCKQGVKSSNLSISTRSWKRPVSYLENCIRKQISDHDAGRHYGHQDIREKEKEFPEGHNAICRGRKRPSLKKGGESWLSEKERRVDALALRAEERRDKLRKAAGRSKYPLIRGSLNGETHMSEPHVSVRQSITYGGEPGELKHLSSRRKRKKHRCRK